MADSTSKKSRAPGAGSKVNGNARPAAKVTAKAAAAKAPAQQKKSAPAPVATAPAPAPAASAKPAARPAVTAASAATLRFKPDWQLSLEGALKTGGKLTIEYAPERAQLRKASWGVQAYVRFAPSGEIREAAAVASAKAAPVTVEVPREAIEVEVWFRNWAGTENSWDSNFGHNYRFRVER